MTDKTRARAGLIVVCVATILTTVSFAFAKVNVLPFTLAVVALWIAAAVIVLPFFTKRRVASMDEYKCPDLTAADVRKKLGVTQDLTVTADAKGYHALYVKDMPSCSDEWIRQSDEAFWAEMTVQHPDAKDRDVSACYLVIVDAENDALDTFLKKGGCEAHVTDAHTRIRVSAAYVVQKHMLYVARPVEEERDLFGKEDVRISTELSHFLRG